MRSLDRQDLPGTELLQPARGSVEYGLIHQQPLPIQYDDLHPALTEPAATFATLRSDGKLRGSCGTLEAAHPLARDVTRSAFRAAYRDTRFEPVGEEELEGIRLEVSVLSPLVSIPVTDEADLLEQLIPGTDGLVIVEGWRRAPFLPKVWESLPDPGQFLTQLKSKCSLPGDYWSGRLEFLHYRTTSYTESV